MKLTEYNNFLNKVKCSEGFRKKMEEKLSAAPKEVHEYNESVSGTEVKRGNKIIKRIGTAAACITIAAVAAAAGVSIKKQHDSDKNAHSDEVVIPPIEVEQTLPTEDVTDESIYVSKEEISGFIDETIDIYDSSNIALFRYDAHEHTPNIRFEIPDKNIIIEKLKGYDWLKASSEEFDNTNFYSIRRLTISNEGYIKYLNKVYKLADMSKASELTAELDAAFEADEISQLEALIFKGANDYTTLEADVTTHYVVPAYESNTGRLYHVQGVGKIYRNVPEGKFYMTLEGERSDSSNPIIVELVCDGINQVQYTEKDKTTGEINVQYEYPDVPAPMQKPTFDYFRLDERVIFFIQRYKERPEEKRKFEVTNGIPITNAYSGSNYYSFSYKEDDGNEYYMRVIVNENGQIIHCDYSYDYSGVQVNLGSNGEIKIDSPDFKMPDIVG